MSSRVLAVSAHPSADGLARRALELGLTHLKTSGVSVDVFDLYGEGFSPVLTPSEYQEYNKSLLGDRLGYHIEALKQADWIIFAYPTWWYAPPAILKGYLDRIWTPGLAFTLKNGDSIGLLDHVRRLSVITTYGSKQDFVVDEIGEPGRLLFERGLLRLFSSEAVFDWIAMYGLDTADESERLEFIERVGQQFLAASKPSINHAFSHTS